MGVNRYQVGKEVPRVYNGKLVEIVPEIVKAEQVPANFAYRMLGILQGKNVWFEGYHDLGDTAVVSAKGRDSGKFKIVHNSERLLGVNEETDLINGRLPVDYSKIKGREFSGENVGKNFSRKEAKENEVYLELCFGNNAFLRAGVDKIFDARGIKGEGMMGIYISGEDEKCALEGAWYVSGLVDGWGSGAVGGGGLDVDGDRLVGVAPEALASLEFILRNETNPDKLWKLLGISEK